MDPYRFDSIVRSLAARTSRRNVAKAVVGAAAGALVGIVHPIRGTAVEDRVTLCHRPGTPDQRTISVAPASVPAHLAHGDYVSPIGCCPVAEFACTNPFIGDRVFCCADGLSCCPSRLQGHDDHCCDETSGEHCCGGAGCCQIDETCCGEGGQFCCAGGDLCCVAELTCCSSERGEQCCPAGPAGCCPEGKCAWDRCCAADEVTCYIPELDRFECCRGETCCDRGGCCPEGGECCSEAPDGCCATGHVCCGAAGCCDEDERCCGPAGCCKLDEQCCGAECIAGGATCCTNGLNGSKFGCPGGVCCGDVCCSEAAGEHCCYNVEIEHGQCCTTPGCCVDTGTGGLTCCSPP